MVHACIVILHADFYPRHCRAALQHQNNFDVCWCRGSVAELLFAPLIERIKSFGGQILGGQLVQRIEVNAYGDVSSVTARCEPTLSMS
jgi:hypothetical protein